MTNIKLERKYCGKCGEEMQREVVGAENFGQYMGLFPWPKYDAVTGERNLKVKVFCPRYRRYLGNFDNGHDMHGEGEVFTRGIVHDKMLPLKIVEVPGHNPEETSNRIPINKK